MLQKQVDVLQKQLVSENPVPACHLCSDMVSKLLVDADGKEEMEAQRDEAMEELAEEPDHNDNILSAISAGWIIPNWFEQEHLDAMEGWDKDHLNQFVHYLNRVVCCRYDFVRQGIEEVLEDFLAE